MMSSPAPIAIALEAAQVAGTLLRRRFARPRQVANKGFRDIVTDADYVAQQAVLDRLRTAFPEHAILAEENLQGYDLDLNAPAPTWIIDPLDGTRNYAHQMPIFAVSIALAQAGALQLGVIYDPMLDETFYAERGHGAFLQRGQGQPEALRVSDVTELAEAIIGMGWPREPEARLRITEATGRLAPACQSLRATGSAALMLAYVAAGRLDAGYLLAIQSWDVAAAALIITEAGGQVSGLDGAAWRIGHRQVVASNTRVHPELIRTLALA